MPMLTVSYPANLDSKIQLQRRTTTRDTTTGAQSSTWETYATVWASVTEATSSRAPDERADGEVNLYGRPTSIKIHWRGDVLPSDRILHDGRPMQVVGTAEIHRRRWLDIAVREWIHEQ